MFKVDDKVRVKGGNGGKIGTIINISNHIHVMFKGKNRNYIYYYDENVLELAIPRYILKWKKRLDV